MNNRNLESCLLELERHKQLIRIKEEIDPHLELAAVHLRVHEKGGPALLFENVRGCKYRCVSNIFGTTERSKLIFNKTLPTVQKLIELKNDPIKSIKKPFSTLSTIIKAISAIPMKSGLSADFEEIQISDLPLIKHWPMDGGAFVTLPQVYSEDSDKPGVMSSNLGMYRIQLNGNDYETNKEIGLHYQLHRGIGIHQTKAAAKGEKLKVSVFVGGHPAHTFAAVMPLPEGISELTFAGVLSGRRFRYAYSDGFCISNDADFVITGEVENGLNKPEGPFGDHLGYYSLKHEFPVMKVHKVFAKRNAIWPFTVVGRPPQEDTAFGNMIHEMTGEALKNEIPGVKEVHAVDAAGVHPLLLAVGSERYTPYLKEKKPAEIITQANRILGTGQLSLAKYLFIAADDENKLSTKNENDYFKFIFERIDFTRDLHFHTNTSIDTLDYSGTGLNSGSKVVFTVYGEKQRELKKQVSEELKHILGYLQFSLALPGVLAVQLSPFINYEASAEGIEKLIRSIKDHSDSLSGIALIVICDNAEFLSKDIKNFLWVTFTRSNPSHDIHGINSFTKNKHWGCNGPLIIDARSKPHHAPELIKDIETENRIERFFSKGGSLYGVI
ncbi:MAG: UbiD family decarboxylase [Bacteroidota bacterium]|jgi:4-hydroxy-3-polyprenylbenzoate decarboxylase